jgi:hypothetical protein
MAFAQLYYTSCESGLSDFAGFQFNAVTPGLAPQVLREVEALTSYEPPRSLGFRPSAAEIAGCPVNLVYRCEPVTVLANVVFVGLDFSQRLGNYFAHALVGQIGADRFDQVLPIELWGSPIWTDRPIAGRELPALPQLPDAAGRHRLTRAGVDRFLAARERPEQLAALVTAAEDAVARRGRSIVVIEADTTAAAQWIAAISFLLPPAVARRMSFDTYRHRPEYSDANVIGTLPESDFDLGDSTFHSYVVFDPASGRISDVVPEPAAALLARAGAVGAAGLWERAATLADLAALSLAECRPVLVAAAVLSRIPVPADDLDALGRWLAADPDELLPDGRAVLLPAFLDHLADVAGEDLDAVVEVFCGGLIDALDGMSLPPALHRAVLLARCRLDLLGLNGAAGGSPIGEWLVRAVIEPSRDGEYLPAYGTLCRAIEDGTVATALPPFVQTAAATFLLVDQELEQARGEAEPVRAASVRRLTGAYPQHRATVQDLLRTAVPGLIDGLAGSPYLCAAVTSCPAELVASYLDTAAERLDRTPTDLEGTSLIFATFLTLRSGQDVVLARELDDLLRRRLRAWPQDRLDLLQKDLQRKDSQLATAFSEWRSRHLAGLLGRSLHRLGRRRPSAVPPNAVPPNADHPNAVPPNADHPAPAAPPTPAAAPAITPDPGTGT